MKYDSLSGFWTIKFGSADKGRLAIHFSGTLWSTGKKDCFLFMALSKNTQLKI
jgi:hypothetical protein